MSGIIAQNIGKSTGLIKALDVASGNWKHISTLTSDGSDSDLSFTSGLNSTYPIYRFEFINIHAETNGAWLMVNFSIDGGSNYNVSKTSSNNRAYHEQGGSEGTALGYDGGYDLNTDTGDQKLTFTNTIANDDGTCGYLYLYSPSNTTYQKMFFSRLNNPYDADYAVDFLTAALLHTTSAIDAITFKMNTGEIQDGKIKMYGLKDS